MIYLAQYGVAWTLRGYKLVDRTTGQYKSSPTLASGDFTVEKDGGASANLATLPSVEPAAGTSISIPFSAAEMQCQQLTLTAIDAAGAEWNDDAIHIFTVGDTLAHWQSDPFDASVAVSAAVKSEIVAMVWAALRVNHTVVGSFGESVAGVIGDITGDVTGTLTGDLVGSVTGSVGSVGTGGITAASFAADALTAASVAADVGQEIADEVLNRNLAGGASGNSRNVRNALRGLRNRVKNQGGTLSVYEEDDTTIAWTAVATTAASNPVVEFDPT